MSECDGEASKVKMPWSTGVAAQGGRNLTEGEEGLDLASV